MTQELLFSLLKIHINKNATGHTWKAFYRVVFPNHNGQRGILVHFCFLFFFFFEWCPDSAQTCVIQVILMCIITVLQNQPGDARTIRLHLGRNKLAFLTSKGRLQPGGCWNTAKRQVSFKFLLTHNAVITKSRKKKLQAEKSSDFSMIYWLIFSPQTK